MPTERPPQERQTTVSVLLKAMLVTGTALAVGGCSTAPSPAEPGAHTGHSGRAVIVNTARSVRNNWGDGRLFALVESKGDRWELIRVSASYPRREDQQEVFLVTRNLSHWETTISPEQLCKDGETGYSVCTSLLTKPGFFGVKRYDFAAVKQAIDSIPQPQAQAVVTQFTNAEAAATARRDEQQAKRWTACYESYKADTRVIEQAGGKAMAAAIAGEQLSPLDMIAIRRMQQRQSIESVCGFSPSSPRK